MPSSVTGALLELSILTVFFAALLKSNLLELPPIITSHLPATLLELLPDLHSSNPSPFSNHTTYCYTGGIRTLDSSNSTHSCLSVDPETGTFSRVFTPKTAAQKGKYEWLDGKVIPGLWDSHGHLMQYGEMLDSVQLYGVKDLEEVRRRVKEYVKEHPGAGEKGRWIRGVGWDQGLWDNQYPTDADLSSDPDLAGLYILLDRIDVHCTWASTPVVSLLPHPFPSIPGGFQPSPGIFCDNSMDLVFTHFPPHSIPQQSRHVALAQASLHSFGIVGLHNAGSPISTINLWDSLALNSTLSLRIYAMLECTTRNSFCPEELSQRVNASSSVILRSVKLFADGALGSYGAALLEPYTDRPDTSGTLLIPESQLTAVTRSWMHHGFQVNIHAIGDRANRAAIDALLAGLLQDCTPKYLPLFERAAAKHADNPTLRDIELKKVSDSLKTCVKDEQKKRRNRIEHAQIIDPADQDRIAEAGIVLSIQPTHATSDSRYAQDRLGKRRLEESAYRLRSLWDQEVPIVLGSDFPVESPDVKEGIRAAVERVGWGGEVFLPKERLEEEMALRGWTEKSAWSVGLEEMAGSVKKGAWADWVVVDEAEGGVKETWVGGGKVYEKEPEQEETPEARLLGNEEIFEEL